MNHKIGLLISILLLLLVGCYTPQATQALIQVNVMADGKTTSLQLPTGSTVQQALEAAQLTLEALDRTEPALYTVLSDGANVRLIRVTEVFEIEQVVIPFEHQIVRNESLARDKEILIQKGKNGVQEITYRRVFEDGVEVSSQPLPVKSVIVEQPVPEIRMIGVQAPFAPIAIPGRLLYLRDGNVWSIEGTTGNRRALITTGDLDGRIFSLSTDGNWLLFTRLETEENRINSLWAANLSAEGGASLSKPLTEEQFINLRVNNVIHFADWLPGSNTKIVFSTVEPRATAPGWQANNDLNALTFSSSGWTTKWTTVLESNSGGIYGWWGTTFLWAPDSEHLAYARPDQVGLLSYKDGSMTPSLEITPLLTRGDWAWVPGISWGPDGNMLFTIDHVSPPGAISPEESPFFDLTAIPITGGPALHIVSQCGMFAYPITSPLQSVGNGEFDYQVAYLQAIFPNQSETSRYRLAVMDRDGSNRRLLFPAEGSTGIEPQQFWGAWSPSPLPESGHYVIALLYQGNIWFVDTVTGEAVQISGDGLTNRVIWK